MAENRAKCKLPIFIGKYSKTYHLRESRLKTAVSGKDLPEAKIYLHLDSKINRKASSNWILLQAHNLHPAVPQCELAKDMWNRLQKRYEEKMVMNKLTLVNNLLNMKYKHEQILSDHIVMLESQFTRLGFRITEIDDSTQLAIKIPTLKECNTFEPLMTLVTVMEKYNLS